MQLSRRALLKLLVASSASIVVSSGLQGCVFAANDESRIAFDYGVASGDPLTDRVVLWTRVTPTSEDPIRLSWEVAEDEAFLQLVNSDSTIVDNQTDYTLKVDVMGLEAGKTYFYRFKSNNDTSLIGQTKTLSSNPQNVKFAVLSCANYPAGFFHVYREVANNASDLDAVIHLGDYIYEYGIDGYPEAGTGEVMNRVHEPLHECVTLADYRQRYAQYHSDPDLIALHAKVPFICLWDDHEIANDAYTDGAENHTELTEGDFLARKMAAIQVWYEWLPVRAPLIEDDKIKTYRQFKFGSILSLMLLDTRVIGRDQQLNYFDYLDAEGNLTEPELLVNDVREADRNLMGDTQLNWLQQTLQSSKSEGVVWQVLGQQVLMARIYVPSSLIRFNPETGRPDPRNFLVYSEVYIAFQTFGENIKMQLISDGTLASYTSDIDGFDGLTDIEQKTALASALKLKDPDLYEMIFSNLSPSDQQTIIELGYLLDRSQNPYVPYNLDAWDGYDAERERLLDIANSEQANLVVLSGDSHNGWCNYVTDNNGMQRAIEFGTGAVSSPGLEVDMGIPGGYEVFIQNSIVSFVKDVEYCNSAQRGYLTVDFTENNVVSEWFVIEREAEKNPVFPVFERTKRISISAIDKVIVHG